MSLPKGWPLKKYPKFARAANENRPRASHRTQGERKHEVSLYGILQVAKLLREIPEIAALPTAIASVGTVIEPVNVNVLVAGS